MRASRLLTGLLLLTATSGCTQLTSLLPGGAKDEAPPPPPPPALAATTAAPPAPSAGASMLLADPPGFEPVGKAKAGEAAPIYVTISLNINDYLRPEREDEAVRRFLDTTEKMGINPVNLSFTGEVLDALMRVDKSLVDDIKKRKPTINEHYRLLQFRRLLSTERELFWTNLTDLSVDRSKYGSVVSIQKAFGVTPRENGGVIAELLRQKWTKGPVTAGLAADGVGLVNKNDLILHPDRLVAAALPGAPNDGHEHVEAYLTVFRMMERMTKHEAIQPTELDARLADLVRWAHVAKLQGVDVTRIEGLATFVDASRLGGFMLAPAEIAPSVAEETYVRTQGAADPAGTAKAMTAVFERMCEITCKWHDPGAEVRDRLAALDTGTAWIARLSWHASNDYTVESWSKNLNGAGMRGTGVGPPAATRSAEEQARIIAAYDAVLTALKENPRVRFIDVDNDTQWLPENSPEKGYPEVFGVKFKDVPGALDPAKVDELARSLGVQPPSDQAQQRQRRPGGQGGGAGGGRPPGGGGPLRQHEAGESGQVGGERVRPAGEGQRRRSDGAHLAPRQPQNGG